MRRGTYQRLIPARPVEGVELCGYVIKVTCPIWLIDQYVRSSSNPDRGDNAFYPKDGRSGIYYRQEFPYHVEITPPPPVDPTEVKEDKREFLVFSPSESPVYFLPVRRTLFSNNKADLAFTEGVPTKYDQSTDGELIGLLKLPADVIGAYFGAIGQIFQYRQGAFDSEQKYLDSQSKLMLEMVKFQACKEAINLGKTGADLKAACGTQQ